MAEKPEDLNLPNAIVTRIVKDALPDGVNISKEARTAISKAASVFVLYTTSSANHFAMKAKRKTLNGQDVLSAMQDMEFEKFVEPLTECLEAFRKTQKGKKEASEKKKSDKEAASQSADVVDDGDEPVEDAASGEESDMEENPAEDDEDEL